MDAPSGPFMGISLRHMDFLSANGARARPWQNTATVSQLCETCNETKDTDHYLCYCQKYGRERPVGKQSRRDSELMAQD